MTTHAWRHFLYDAHVVDGTGKADLIGEITEADDRTLNQGIRQMATASLSVDRDHALADELALGHTRLLVIRDGRPTASPTAAPMFVGPVVGYEETGDRIGVTAADAFWRMTKRRIGVFSIDFDPAGTDLQKAFSGVGLGGGEKKSWMISLAIGWANELYAPHAGDGVTNTFMVAGNFSGLLGPGTPETGIAGEGPPALAGPYVFAQASSVIQEISNSLDGPEWMVTPIMPRISDMAGADAATRVIAASPVPDNSMVLGQMNLKMVMGGVQRDEALFAKGYGPQNVEDYKRIVSSDGAANWMAALPSDDGLAVAYRDLTATPTNPVVLQDVVQTDVVIAAMRAQIAQDHVTIRQHPREVITFDPLTNLTGSVPVLGTATGGQYDIGDVVPFRVVKNGQTKINALMRVYGVQRALTTEGDEITAPVLVPNA